MPAAEVGEQTAISPKTCCLCTARLRSLYHSKYQSLETKRRARAGASAGELARGWQWEREKGSCVCGHHLSPAGFGAEPG